MKLLSSRLIILKLSLLTLFISFSIISFFVYEPFWNLIHLIGGKFQFILVFLLPFLALPLIPLILGIFLFYRCSVIIKLALPPSEISFVDIIKLSLVKADRNLVKARTTGFIGVFMITNVFAAAYYTFSDATFKARVTQGTAQIGYAVLIQNTELDSLTDENLSIKRVIENFDILELDSDTGRALHFIPKEGVEYKNICIDNYGYIRSFSGDSIVTYGDCMGLRITDSVHRVDSTLKFKLYSQEHANSDKTLMCEIVLSKEIISQDGEEIKEVYGIEHVDRKKIYIASAQYRMYIENLESQFQLTICSVDASSSTIKYFLPHFYNEEKQKDIVKYIENLSWIESASTFPVITSNMKCDVEEENYWAVKEVDALELLEMISEE